MSAPSPEEVARLADEQDLVAVMRTKEGARLLQRLMVQAGLYSRSFDVEPTAMAFNEGRRDVAIRLLSEIQRVCPELHVAAQRDELNAAERRLALRGGK